MTDFWEQQQQYREERWEATKAERRAERERERFVQAAASDNARYVHCQLPRCPSCGGTKHKAYRSIDQGDGSRMKWTRCECGEKFIVILE